MTRLLAFDTAGPWCAACLLDADKAVVRVDDMAKGQAEHLMPMLEEVLQANGLVWADLEAIGVGTGPGNFTGIRISVAAARGLALGLKVPAIGVTHLEAQAFGAPRPATAIIPAPRGQAYLQHFGTDTEAPELVPAGDSRLIRPPAPLDPAVLIRTIARIAADRAPHPQPRPVPCYVRPADAAPPKVAAPQIIA